jgi:UDP-glucose 4-epimerase
MNILVIGSKGFIGSHVLHYFKEQEHVVFGCDVVVDYTQENYFLIDTANADFQELFETTPFDVCINCSGAASVPDSIIHPQRDFELNVNNVFKLLDAIRKQQPSCKFINLSSAAVYGNPAVLPVKEDAALLPVSPYGLHKQMAESVLREFYTQFNISTLSLRIFSVYGPGLQKTTFLGSLQKNENKPK